MNRIGTNTAPFQWHVDADGYQWTSIKGKKWLSTLTPVGVESKVGIYQPLTRYTGLFRDFATLDPTSKGEILTFANNYGMLGNSKLQSLNGTAYSVESGQDWGVAICAMKRAVDIWDAVQSKDRHWLGRHIQWKRLKTSVEFVSESQRAVIANKNINSHLLPIIAGNSHKAATFHLQSEVNKALEGQASPTLLLNDGQLELFNMPKSLLSAMWLQLALAISGNRKYETCAWCGSQFDISAYRKGKKTCSDSCRNLLSRDKRKKS